MSKQTVVLVSPLRFFIGLNLMFGTWYGIIQLFLNGQTWWGIFAIVVWLDFMWTIGNLSKKKS